MTNLPESLYVDPTCPGPSSCGGSANPSPEDRLASATTAQLIVFLRQPQYREQALAALNKKRETCKELALLLWNSFNTIYIFLQEVISVYKLLSPSKLTIKDSTRVCNALALLQCMAAHPGTRMSLIKAKIPAYLYPFLSTTEKQKPFEFLRLTSLGVIGTLVKVDDLHLPQVIHFLLETEIFPLCLRCMEMGNELEQMVAIFIVSKILMQEQGLKYVDLVERFFAVGNVLAGMVEKISQTTNPRLLKHIISCYLRLSEMPGACDPLRQCIPAKLTDTTSIEIIRQDNPEAMKMLQQLLYNISTGR